MVVSKIKIEEALSDLNVEWIFFNAFFRVLEMNLFIGAFFYFYNKTALSIALFMGILCLGVYGMFIFKLIRLMIDIVDAQTDIGKIRKGLYKLMITIFILIFMGLFFYAALMLGGNF